MSRILLTGAGGHLGKILRVSLAGCYETLRLSDMVELEPAAPGEEIVHCDLADADAVMAAVQGCDAILHFGGMSVENSFEVILNSNIRGTYNVYEAARKNGVGRILFASSNHAIGFHARETHLDARSEMRPDSMYGVSKCFGENLARYYFDKYGIETVCVRIGSCLEKPRDRRMMSTWLSFRDLTSLVRRTLDADRVGFAVVYGASDNEVKWWDNSETAFLGWQPKDSSVEFSNDPAIVNEIADPHDPANKYQGGAFAAAGHFED